MTFYGNQYTTPDSTYSHEQLVDAARELGEELGRSPTTREAEADNRFPSLTTIYSYAEGGWGGVLEDAGLKRTQVRAYGSEEEPRMCADLVEVFEKVDTPYLTHRQYDDLGAYPTSVVKEQFGSWKVACDAAGLSSGQKHGTDCTGPLGERLDSYRERRVAIALCDREIEYVSHPSIEETNWVSDFYLPELLLWVEVDGYAAGTRPNERGFKKKVAHLREQGESVVVVETAEELVTKIEALLSAGRETSE